MEIEAARHNMISQQIRALDVLDDHLLDILTQTPRELFVPEALKNLAFADHRLPIGEGQTMMSPGEESRILQSLMITKTDKVLEIGTGTGYMTALLAKLAFNVLSLDVFKSFTESAKNRLGQLGLNNVILETHSGLEGWSKSAPFDVILVSGSTPQFIAAYRQQLAVGGRLFSIVGKSPAMSATLTKRLDEVTWQDQILFETDIMPLEHSVKREPFIF